MAKFIDDEAKEQLLHHFSHMDKPVTLHFFGQKHACASCREQEALLKELAALSNKITLKRMDLLKHAKEAEKLGVNKVPATAVVGEKDWGMRFYGLCAGYEFTSLVESILMASLGFSGLKEEARALLTLIDVPVHLEIFVTTTCPYCPQMVHLALQMAMENELVTADMVESSEYPHLVQRYDVGGVPRTIINEKPAFEGALPAANAIMEILKEVKPGEYENLEKKVRQARGDYMAREAEPEHLYDTVIVGAGAAALNAAIYAARKSMDVALLGAAVGGQMTNTATVENWLGMPSVGGLDLAASFREHAERYPIAERVGVMVEKVEKTKDGNFRLFCDDGKIYMGRTVIWAAGKKYRRLGVPGEEKFLGKSIAFCATCDAPLYRDKKVAVVGGGNSAFTAARDLLNWASEIHVINILPDFQADQVLMEEVAQAPNVRFHRAWKITEYLGRGQLAGVRMVSADGEQRMDLSVDGVFLEIGLIPNTKEIKGLVKLNKIGEVLTRRNQSTSLPGFYAAGDVTDEPEKQIIVAAAGGAKAALSAYSHLKGGKPGQGGDEW